MKTNVWFISKYNGHPKYCNGTCRTYFITHELKKIGHKVAVISSDFWKGSLNWTKDNYKKEKSKKETYFLESDKLTFLTISTFPYKLSKSFERIISWIDFEIKLFFLPVKKLFIPNVVIISTPSLLTIINGLIFKLRFRSKLIIEVRDIWPLNLTAEGNFRKNNFLIKFLSLLEYLGYRYCDHIVGTMPNLEKHIMKIIPIKKKVSCIPNGYDPTYFSKITKSETAINIDSNKFYIGYFGSFGITNALETVFHAAHLLRKDKSIHFLFVGDGQLKKSFENKFKKYSNITFIERINHEEVFNLSSKCDLLYFSVKDSIVWKYGQSLNKVVDYMLSGRPILASYDGFQSMINEADCGFFVKPGDAISLSKKIKEISYLPKEYLTKMGNKGKQWILKERPFEFLAKQYSEILISTIKK